MSFPSLDLNVSSYDELFYHLPTVNDPNKSGSIVQTAKIPPARTVPDQTTKPLFALIIGINRYACGEPLQGAVKDATDMRDYLLLDLKVPNSQIRFLTEEQAKRNNIIAAFREIRDDNRIKKDDPILIYYAGHGSQTDAPTSWPSGDVKNQIQMLVPQDYSDNATTPVHGLPDYTLGALLNEIAERHGDNITVIFDSCHSGSGTTGFIGIRGLPLERRQPIPPNLDIDIWSSASPSTLPAFSTNGSSSHVLLAACTQEEKVTDSEEGGKFTQGILRVTKSMGIDKLTYVSLLHRIDKITGQNPQCKGNNRDRSIFDAKAPVTGRVCFPIKMNGTAYEMQAGTAHGITEGAEFSLHNDSLTIDESNALCILAVDSADDIGPFTTTLRIKQSFSALITLSKTSCVLQTKAGTTDELELYVPPDDELLNLYKALAVRTGFQSDKRQIHPTAERKNARIGLSIENGRIVFNYFDPRLAEYGITRMPHSVANDPNEIIPVLEGAANFYGHLNRQAQHKVVDALVEIECHTLEPTDQSDISGKRIMTPIGENHIKAGVIDIEASAQTMYGYTITNKSDRDLYLNAYYFNNTDFSIVPYFQSATGGPFKSHPTLDAKRDIFTFSSLKLGYGPGGGKSFRYSLKDGVDIDVGYLVFYITDVNINLSTTLPQETPFGAMALQESVQVDRPARPVYGTKLVRIVRRRPKA